VFLEHDLDLAGASATMIFECFLGSDGHDSSFLVDGVSSIILAIPAAEFN